MLPEERKNKIFYMINEKGSMRVHELSRALGITEATVRRDLDELQAEARIKRTHGGAISIYPASLEYAIAEWESQNLEEKRAIAQTAYALIEENDAVILDSSTTAHELARKIAHGNKKQITMVTSSFKTVSEFSGISGIQIIHTGGLVYAHKRSASGPVSERMLRDIRADKTFIGVNGIEIEYGYSTPGFDEASLKSAMLRAARQSFVLADHTKFRRSYLGKIAPIAEVDYLITDRQTPDYDAYLSKLKAMTHVILADG